MAKYGSLIPMDVVREFQANCRSWAKELKMYYQEYAAVQQELADLAKEIGISHGAAGVNKQGEDNGPTDSDAEFDEMVKEMKQAGKTWVTKMDKLEKVRAHLQLLSMVCFMKKSISVPPVNVKLLLLSRISGFITQ